LLFHGNAQLFNVVGFVSMVGVSTQLMVMMQVLFSLLREEWKADAPRSKATITAVQTKLEDKHIDRHFKGQYKETEPR
jgi:hypothetical protein